MAPYLWRWMEWRKVGGMITGEKNGMTVRGKWAQCLPTLCVITAVDMDTWRRSVQRKEKEKAWRNEREKVKGKQMVKVSWAKEARELKVVVGVVKEAARALVIRVLVGGVGRWVTRRRNAW